VCTVDAEEVARRKALAWWEALEPEQRLVEQDWQARLSPLQFRVLRQRQTEDAGSGEHVTEATAGSYACAGCALPLYHSRHKFPPEASVHGWPAFGDNIDGKASASHPLSSNNW
jgi:peptide-methionine (R)-S-oxide reductase